MRFGAMEDMVLLIPALKALQQRYGRPCELVTSGSWSRPLMERVPACGPVHLLTSRRAPYLVNRSQWRLVDTLRQRPTGPVYLFESDEKSLSLLGRGGVKPEWICSLRDLAPLPGEHVATHALRFAHQTPTALIGRPEFSVTRTVAPDARPVLREADRSDCAAWLAHRHITGAQLVLFQIGHRKAAGRRDNVDSWPEKNWGEVIAGVRQLLPSSCVLICGTPAERRLAENIMDEVPGRRDGILIATNDLPLPRLLALQERAHSQIGLHTGPAYSAAAMGCPEVVMSTRAPRTGPDCEPLPTTAPMRVIYPDLGQPGAGLDAITPSTLITAWHEVVTGFWQQR